MFFVRRLVDQIVHVLAGHWTIGRDNDGFQAVDLLELVGFGIRRAGHAGQAVVHAEIVLEGDRGQGLVLGLDRHAFLGLDGLMQAIGPAAACHQAASELIDNDHFAVLHDVMLILVEQGQRAQGRIQVMHQRNIGGIVQAGTFAQQTGLGQQLLGTLVAGLGEVNLMALLVHPVVALGLLFGGAAEQRDDILHAQIEIGVIVRLTGNDQRRAGFVDQDGVDFIDDREIQGSLHTLVSGVDHVVAQIVEAEFVIRTVGDIGSVGGLFLLMRHLREIHPHAEAEETVQTPHPLGVTRGEIVVHGDDVHALAGDGIEVGRQGADQSLAFAGPHFSNFAVMQDHAPDHLDIEMTHAQNALTRLADHRKRLGQQGIEGFTVGVTLTEFVGFGLKLIVRQRLHGRLKRIDALDGLGILLDQPVIAAAENLFE